MCSRRRAVEPDPRVRAILAGEKFTTARELLAFLGGDPDADDVRTRNALTWCTRQLEAHGYHLRYVQTGGVVGPRVLRWVRLEDWPEDEAWPDVQDDDPEWLKRATLVYL